MASLPEAGMAPGVTDIAASRTRTRLYWLGYLAVTMLSMMGADLGNRYA